ARGARLCWGEMVECVGSGVRGGKMEGKGFNGVAGNNPEPEGSTHEHSIRWSRSPSILVAIARTFKVILFSIHNDEWKSFHSQLQIALRISRWSYNLIPAESRFKTLCSINKDTFKESLIYQSLQQISNVQALPQKNMLKIMGMTLEEIREKFIPVWNQIEDFIPMASKEEGERFKRKGLRLEQGSAKKMKTSEEVSEEDLKEMMQLVLAVGILAVLASPFPLLFLAKEMKAIF
nr:hypothetical protein [Tanacetum cinerariifolium]